MAGPERPMSNLSGRLGRRGERSVEDGQAFAIHRGKAESEPRVLVAGGAVVGPIV